MDRQEGETMYTAKSPLVHRSVRLSACASVADAVQSMKRGVYAAGDVLSSAPRAKPGLEKLRFFCPDRYLESDDDLKREYDRRGLTPAEPEWVIRLNADDPDFATVYPNATIWHDGRRWCYIKFHRHLDAPLVSYGSNADYDRGWGECMWYFAGRSNSPY